MILVVDINVNSEEFRVPARIDILNKKFGMLTVTRELGKDTHNNVRWECVCECGRVTNMPTTKLTQKKSPARSCGKHGRELEEGEASFNVLIYKYKKGASDRGYDFLLSNEEVRELTKGDCHYCGEPPAQKAALSGNGVYVYNGIDRIDNDLGYTKANCVSCCKRCNRAKSNRTFEDFRSWVVRVASRLQALE